MKALGDGTRAASQIEGCVALLASPPPSLPPQDQDHLLHSRSSTTPMQD